MATIEMDYSVFGENEELVRKAHQDFQRQYSRYWSEKEAEKFKPIKKTPRAERAKVARLVFDKMRRRIRKAETEAQWYDIVDAAIIEYLMQLKRLAEEGYTVRYAGIGRFYSIKGELGFKAATKNEK